METFELIELEFTQSGAPALWEEGGGYTNTGWARIVASPDGGPKKPAYVRKKGPLACTRHAQVPVETGDHVVVASHHGWDYTIRVYRIEKIEGKYATLRTVANFENGGWNPPLPDEIPELEKAVGAARQKARCYHCREPHYVAE
jgi:hypothetical protein